MVSFHFYVESGASEGKCKTHTNSYIVYTQRYTTCLFTFPSFFTSFHWPTSAHNSHKNQRQLLKRFFFILRFILFFSHKKSVYSWETGIFSPSADAITWRREGTRSPVLVHANKNPSVENKEYLTAVHRILDIANNNNKKRHWMNFIISHFA